MAIPSASRCPRCRVAGSERWVSLLACAGFVCALQAAHAQTPTQSSRTGDSRTLQSDNRPALNAKLEEYQAHEWGLQQDEWARYRQLMQGPLGIYSPNLDPLTALGIEARSDQERRHWAELQVQAEGRRTEKLLAYQRAYDEAWKRLHPTLTPLTVPEDGTDIGATVNASASRAQRLAVFVKDSCSACDRRVRELQASGREMDVYMVGSRQDDSRIRQWAASTGIDPAKVRAGTITLNHDAGRWLSLGGQGELPAVLTQVEGQWQRE
jgi:integrating conjugative element protein (TIGR03759 family)